MRCSPDGLCTGPLPGLYHRDFADLVGPRRQNAGMTTDSADVIDQAHAFEFLHGSWEIHNTKLRDTTDPACTEWHEFDATSEVIPILNGIGQIDRMTVPAPPDGPAFEGFTLRLFDPVTSTWSIWWSSTRLPGRLDPPVRGTWVDAVGRFECDDVIAGRPTRVRFEWRRDNPHAPTWEQFFSYDHGQTWAPNWLMQFKR
jgi:hypothetical protein